MPLVGALLLSCAVVPGLAFAERPASVAVGLLVLVAAGPGLGYLILRYTCPHLPYRVRLAAAVGLGFALLGPAQLMAGLAGPTVACALDVAVVYQDTLTLAWAMERYKHVAQFTGDSSVRSTP